MVAEARAEPDLPMVGASAPSAWLQRAGTRISTCAAPAAWVGLAFWIWYSFLRQVAGPLNPDEIYFAHHFWLLNEGKRQYLDFYSIHLPVYFQLLKPLVAAFGGAASDLGFLVGLRVLSAAIIASYGALAWWVLREGASRRVRGSLVATLALLLVFLVLARMVEIRADTIGLLLVNCAWAAVLASPTMGRMRLAAVVAGLSILFTARAGGNALVLGIALLSLAVRSRDWQGVRSLLYVAAGFVLAGFALYLAAPDAVMLVIRSCFLEPTQLIVGWSLPRRFLAPERLPLTLLILLGLLSGIVLARRGEKERGLIVAVACAGQLLTIAVDPNPFEYVYGWAALPAVFGIVSVSRPFAALFPFLCGLGAVVLCLGYMLKTGESPPTASPFRLTPDTLVKRAEVDRMPTQQLVARLVDERGQKNLANQLRLRSELCRRVAGTVVSTFDAHPICLQDAFYHWTDLRWPAVMQGDAQRAGAMSQQEFATMFKQARPKLFIWGHRWEPPRPLLPEMQEMLACCYDVYDGFAVARDAPPEVKR
jgi:hypothetical protein